jgi:hypothetical protein
VLNSCIGVSDYNEQYSLCQPLLPSPLSTLGLTRSTQRQTTPLQQDAKRSNPNDLASLSLLSPRDILLLTNIRKT